MVVIGTIDEWKQWTGDAVPDWSGTSVDVGGLVPVVLSADRQIGIYSEPNVWVVHDLDP